MKIIKHSTEIEIAGVSDFDPVKIFECGQCFRWNKDENGTHKDTAYIGVAFGHVVRVRFCNDSVFISASVEDFETIWRSYFDLDRDYAKIRQQLCIDDYMLHATTFGAGIRLLRQDKWEALCSFIISQNNNIPRIKVIIETLCREFGDVIIFNDKKYYTFPSAEKVAMLDVESLDPLRCGYRAKYIIGAAKAVDNGSLRLEALSQGSLNTARTALKELKGVGDKVADCVMLFGLHMLDAFPVDVWIKRAIKDHYNSSFDPCLFSPYAGIAQQYIFYYIRNNTFHKAIE
ncbi:MAG: DNA-3-methyladenine glycosylase [Oscillospiraceae bacterium]|jgi:N-glycosylase/DNA lyase|nr:DNA-3-methyladenine glycosylase [Oscillospiraceae bacterium]